MKLKEPKNKNYCATVVKVDKLVPLEGCDNVQAAIIFGNQVIVSKEINIGNYGLFFPIETRLSESFLGANNLFKNADLNADKEKKGYFETNGRIRAVKFRGHKSEGFFIPLNSLVPFIGVERAAELEEGQEFDEIGDWVICEKYVVKTNQNLPSVKKKGKDGAKRVSRLVPNQFHLHVDTENLRKNIHKIRPTDVISIGNKIHGTSFVLSRVLTKTKLTWYEKIVDWFYRQCPNYAPPTEYSIVYSSRKVIKNEFETKDNNHYYGYDLWAEIADKYGFAVENGITLYGEAAGYTKEGGFIQNGYDYGQLEKTFGVWIYRITSTSATGKVYEFSQAQIKQYCNKYGLNICPEFYYGKAQDLFPLPLGNQWHDQFLSLLESKFNLDKDCDMCVNKVPAEGLVLRVDDLFEFQAYKLKSYRFLERETKELDKGVVDIESQESQAE